MVTPASAVAPARKLNIDFWKFLTGETISNLGSSFTLFALPLLIYQLTSSAVNLALATAANFLPYLFFGLLIGAWADRLNRKRMMILVDIGNAVVIGSIPLLAALGFMSHQVFFVGWIYGVGFASSILTIFFQSGEFAAIPSLVGRDELVTANGRIQASYSAAQV
ncbi:MAG TPA: MFS transporter, partial [Ktedonobacterales bacterium]|nr:MFS transporter [Ktedonobacterales bacterium]